MTLINLGAVSIEAGEYASQGNAVLGIRASGKSYASTYLAERLMDAGIPIIAFDPIGIWRFLRVEGKGNGFPVVVAGGEHGDLPLTPQSAPEIVRAAMREGVSLIIDLYSMELSKADWRRIVETSIKVLLYENKPRGLRHVFIEEAAEFAPQNVRPDQGAVYDVVERLGRMGGNALLGYTLVNQRAEQVNKAILELCDSLFLFRQKGKNSLTSLSKWLGVADAKGGKDIINSLPTLAQGECWAWLSGTDTPVKVHIPAKRTFHPDRRAMHDKTAIDEHKTVNVSAFVEHMKGSLEKFVEEAKANDPSVLKKEIARLERQIAAGQAEQPIEIDEAELDRAHAEGFEKGIAEGLERASKAWEVFVPSLAHFIEQIAHDADALGARLGDFSVSDGNYAKPMQPPPRAPTMRIKEIDTRRSAPSKSENGHAGALPGPQQRILDALAWWESVGVDTPSRVQIAVVAEYSPSGGAFLNPLGALRTSDLIEYPLAGHARLTHTGRRHAHSPDAAPTTAELHRKILGILDGPQQRIISPLLRTYPRQMTRDQLAQAAGYEPKGGAFLNPLGALRSLKLIAYPRPGEVAALPILFIGGRR